MSHGHDHVELSEGNKRVAIFISVLVLGLAISEALAKSAQTSSLSYNVETSNLWEFYQAKAIRQTILKTAAERMAVDAELAQDSAVKQRFEKRISDWNAVVQRYESEPKPSGGEGRKELFERANEAGEKRDLYAAKYHHYEIAAATFQIATVLASVYLITSFIYLLWSAFGLGIVGIVFAAIGLFFPHALHLF
jgi:hypothetical protein